MSEAFICRRGGSSEPSTKWIVKDGVTDYAFALNSFEQTKKTGYIEFKYGTAGYPSAVVNAGMLANYNTLVIEADTISLYSFAGVWDGSNSTLMKTNALAYVDITKDGKKTYNIDISQFGNAYIFGVGGVSATTINIYNMYLKK